jgi:CRISPR system Cascade subunit CasC
MKTLIEIHVLQNFAPSNLNRDDTGAPKDAFFGGTRRARVSSQCNKRAVRQFFNEKVSEGFFSADELAVRTKRIYAAVADVLAGKRDSEETIKKTRVALSYVKVAANKKSPEKTQYLLFMGKKEIDSLAQAIDTHWEQILQNDIVDTDNDEAEGKKKKGNAKKDAANSAPKELKEKLEAIFNGGKAVDVALFGRMLADMPQKNQNAACQVAHAISTHAVEREFDFYTAVDDCKPDDSAGSDMMGTIEFIQPVTTAMPLSIGSNWWVNRKRARTYMVTSILLKRGYAHFCKVLSWLNRRVSRIVLQHTTPQSLSQYQCVTTPRRATWLMPSRQRFAPNPGNR